MKTDILNIEVLESGLMKIDTNGVSQPNHVSAENFVRECARLMGGPSGVKRKRQGHGHHHEHEHEHGGEHHTT